MQKSLKGLRMGWGPRESASMHVSSLPSTEIYRDSSWIGLMLVTETEVNFVQDAELINIKAQHRSSHTSKHCATYCWSAHHVKYIYNLMVGMTIYLHDAGNSGTGVALWTPPFLLSVKRVVSAPLIPPDIGFPSNHLLPNLGYRHTVAT